MGLETHRSSPAAIRPLAGEHPRARPPCGRLVEAEIAQAAKPFPGALNVIRRDFLHNSGAMAWAALAASRGVPLAGLRGAVSPIPAADRKALADVALEKARSLGATYTDVRIGRYLNQFLSARETRIQNITDTESYGVGIRVIARGAWGFAATNDVTPDGVARAAAEAVAVARASSALITDAGPAGAGEGLWGGHLEDAHRAECLRGVDRRKGRPAQGGERGGDEERRRLQLCLPRSGQSSRSTSLPPTAPTSIRTFTGSVPISAPPRSTRPTGRSRVVSP